MIAVFWHGFEIGVMLAGLLLGGVVVLIGVAGMAVGILLVASLVWDFVRGFEADPPYRHRDPP